MRGVVLGIGDGGGEGLEGMVLGIGDGSGGRMGHKRECSQLGGGGDVQVQENMILVPLLSTV